MDRRPRVFTIPASVAFLPTLVQAMVDGTLVPGIGRDPLSLAAAIIYLPTRRACRLAREVFLDVLKMDAAILPRMVAIGDIDEDEIDFAAAATGAAAGEVLELPPVMGELERRALLAKLILAWAEGLNAAGASCTPLIVNTPAAAFALADELARLIDDMTTREVSWDRLDGLVPDDVDQYWQVTLQFLKLARTAWPRILAARGMIEPAERRDRLIAAEVARLTASPDRPVIAAGSTGSMPATAKLLATIARLPRGAVVLPGLDTSLDESSWQMIGGLGEDRPTLAAGHPQFAMQALLAQLQVVRTDVSSLAGPSARDGLVSEAMRPAATTDRWRERLTVAFAARMGAAVAGVTVIEAANSEEEALAIAAALREVMETPGKIAALVTPDRALAQRVAGALGRWRIAVDDSGGEALARTRSGIFARLVADAGLGGLAPVPLLALMKHPLFRLGAGSGAHLECVAALERAVLRGPRPRSGSDGLAHALASVQEEIEKLRRGQPSDMHRSDPRTKLTAADLDGAADLVTRLTVAIAPLASVASAQSLSLAALAACHRDALTRLSTDETGAATVFADYDGMALAAAFDDITALADANISIAPRDYGELFLTAISPRFVRRPDSLGARVHICGPLEARLMRVDRVVLGGLEEGIWPPEARTDPWLTRRMRLELGLDLPERRIGLSAHDFAQLLGTEEVVLTRATKRAGTPTMASRFLQRLAAVTGTQLWSEATARGKTYLGWAHGLDRPARVAPTKQPQPCPPRQARPTALSVTEIEHWLRDPYTIYARHILRLERLNPVDLAPTAADRGSAIHGAIGDFVKKFGDALPADAYAELLAFGRDHFAKLDDFPEARALWWPRFVRIARWFANWEQERRKTLLRTTAEVSGHIDIALGERTFRLTGRADRIEQRADNCYAILDFKTGDVPTDKQVRIGLSPQLTLEAAIARAGGFPAITNASVAELIYVKLGGGEPPGESRVIDFDGRTPDAAADYALARLKALASRFEDPDTPYRSLVRPMWKHRYGTYDDLARVKEWSETGGEASEG